MLGKKKDVKDPKTKSFDNQLREGAGETKDAIEKGGTYYYLFIHKVTSNDDADYVCYELFGEKNADVTI